MRSVALVILALFSATLADVTVDELSVYNYHQRVGIPQAARIRAYENSTLSRYHDPKIVGGAVSQLGAHPYLGGLIIDLVNVAWPSVCGSSLLTTNRLLTAAHCWFDGVNNAWRFTVVLGSQALFTGGQRFETTSVVVHPSYNFQTIFSDVAVVYLSGNAVTSILVQPIALPSTSDVGLDFFGYLATAAGYGKTSDAQTGVTTTTVVSEVSVSVMTVLQCQATFGTIVQPSNICTQGTGGVGICGGDSGGPLVTIHNGLRILIGVSSFVASNGCSLGFPSAYARTTSFLPWIQAQLW